MGIIFLRLLRCGKSDALTHKQTLSQRFFFIELYNKSCCKKPSAFLYYSLMEASLYASSKYWNQTNAIATVRLSA
jgi:hypothetical protein